MSYVTKKHVLLLVIFAGLTSMYILSRAHEWDMLKAMETLKTNDEEQPSFISKDIEEVNFCGKIYKANRVFINRINIVQRIANIANENKNEAICENINKNNPENVELLIDLRNSNRQGEYYLTISVHSFKIDSSSRIFLRDDFSGEFSKMIGTL